MYLIVGLGNPEPEYSKTRHNMGFDVINKLANQYKIDISRTKFEGLYGSGVIEGEKVILLKPQTYMNLSGQSIKKYISDAQRCGLIIVKGTDIEKTKKKALEVRNRINRDIVRE